MFEVDVDDDEAIGREIDKFKAQHADAGKNAMEHPSTLLGTATAVQAGLRNSTEKDATTIGDGHHKR